MAPTTQQLKNDIDSGQTGDKVAEGFDLGLSSLGTDDEAAGSPNTPEQVAMARALERRDTKAPPELSAKKPTPGLPAVWVIVGVFAVLIVGAVIALMGARG